MSATGSTSDLLQQMSRNIETIIGEETLIERLDSGRQLRIKFGVDCTAPDLHIGHAVNLFIMRQLQDHGHKVVLLLGDLTTQIGDPTGKSATRPVLSETEIETNAQAFLQQAEMVLDTRPEVFEVRRNSEWFNEMSVAELLRLFAMVTHAQMMARDMFRDRVAKNQEIALHELTYPVLQGFDSVALRSDLTIVGSDQLFNEMMGRHFQERHGQDPQVVITTTITPGLDGGAKQSKSLNNFVALADTPADKFGKIMSIADELVGVFGRAYTDLPLDEVALLADAAAGGGQAARDAKMTVAQAVVARFHDTEAGARQHAQFLQVFSAGQQPETMPTVVITHGALRALDLIGLAEPDLTNNERRKLITQGGVRINGTKVLSVDEEIAVEDGAVLRIGKRRWHRITYPAQSRHGVE